MNKLGARAASSSLMDIKVADALSLLMMRINSNLNDSVALVRDFSDVLFAGGLR